MVQVECRTLRTIYLGAPSRLLEALRRAPDEVETLMLIGHNPGLGRLAVTLCGAGPKKALAQMAVNNGSNPAQVGPAANGLALQDTVDGFTIFNVSAGFTMGSEDQYRLSAYISNLTDKAFSGKGFINDSVNLRYLNTPRTYGVQFAAKF